MEIQMGKVVNAAVFFVEHFVFNIFVMVVNTGNLVALAKTAMDSSDDDYDYSYYSSDRRQLQGEQAILDVRAVHQIHAYTRTNAN